MDGLANLAGRFVGRGRVAAARRQHPRLVVTSGPLTTLHAHDVLAALDERPLRQPNATNCGPSCLVLERMLRNEPYGTKIVGARRPVDDFAHDVRALHRRAGWPIDLAHRPQLPWPTALGTRPAAAARILTAPAGFGAPGTRYGRYLVDPDRPDVVYDVIAGTVRAGEPVVICIGTSRTPRHIVLAVGIDDRVDDPGLRLYDPSFGGIMAVPRDRFTSATLRVAGWDTPWLALLPR